ncbi:MAG: metallophosphoesterase [Candidatus Aminicenantes bacterium]|nr:metallophosphoesterase [Candidatus Aminicenantes bacterium]
MPRTAKDDRPSRRRFVPARTIGAILLAWAVPAAAASAIPCVWTGVERIVAVGDLHGDYDNFVDIMKATGMVDERLHWAGGRTHFVQTGDILDRGPAARKILEFLMRIEVEAALDGGKVHVLLGNHEALNLAGIAFDYPGYVNVDQFLSFLPAEYKDRLVSRAPASEVERAAYWAKILRSDKEAQAAYTRAFVEDFGPWLLKRNCVEKINDVVFVHGGISLKYAGWDLAKINAVLRDELSFLSEPVKNPRILALFRPQIVYDRIGPLWYRDLAQRDETEFAPEVDRILALLGARAMIVAHSPQIGSPIALEYMSRFQKRIWVIDTGITAAYGGRLSALIIDKGQFSVWGDEDE